MALDFPNNPSLNDTYSLDNKTWIYTGLGWRLQGEIVDANLIYDHANGAFDAANASSTLAQNAYNHANGAFVHANSAYDTANNKFNSSGGTISGDVIVTGNINVSSVIASVNLEAENIIAHTKFFAGIATESATLLPNVVAQFTSNSSEYIQTNMQNIDPNGSSDYVATADVGDDSTFYVDLGIHNSTREFGSLYALDSYLFAQGNTGQLGGNLMVGTGTTDTSLRFVIGGIEESNVVAITNNTSFNINRDLVVTGEISSPTTTRIYNHANGAFDAANSASTLAQNAYDYANTIVSDTQIDPYARAHANGSFDAANTAQSTADGAYTHANGAFDAANTAQSTAQAAFNAANVSSQIAFSTISANGTNLVADANTDTLSITSATSNGIFVTGDADTDSLDIGLIDTGVSATGYGDSVSIPVFVVDAKGRLTSVTNTTIRSATTSETGITQLTDAVDSTSTTTSATPNSVKSSYDLANTANINAATAQSTADGAQTHAEGAFTQANTNATNVSTAQTHADGAFDAANTAQTTADAAFGQANTATTNASTAQTTADGAYAHANGAFDAANTKFASAGGTVSGFVDVTQNVTVGSYVDLNTAPSNPTHSEGRLFYDNTQKSLAYYNEDSEMTLQIGQETVVRVYNKSGATINNASVVRITGSGSWFSSN